MHIETFIKRLDRLVNSDSGFKYNLGDTLNESDFTESEKKLGITIHQKVKDFFLVANGLTTINPDFEIIDLKKLIIENQLIQFATFNRTISGCFKIDKLNDAYDWTIVNKETGYEITKTISSFWSNKIWHWLEKRHKIWADNWWEN